MRITVLGLTLIAIAAGSWTFLGQTSPQGGFLDNHIAMLDNCDPADPEWDTVGGCALERGSVSLSEFNNLLFSPLSGTIPVGHPSWRNDPSYTFTPARRMLHIRNGGGRAHTFTEVANYGGGMVPPLNGSLQVAPECTSPGVVVVPPGGTQQIGELAPGIHKFMCCIHPWMRAAVEVK
jgi:hypothetical protein